MAKTGGNYAASLRAGNRAEQKGYTQVLWLDGVHRKYIEEVGAMNVMFKVNGKIDLSMVRHIADETAVMYLGTMVEYGPTEEVYGHPAHPYTQGLLSAVPVADPDYEKTHHRIPMEGEVPSPIDPKPGCRFCGRCPRATEQCRTQTPAPKDLSGGHFAACHHLD